MDGCMKYIYYSCLVVQNYVSYSRYQFKNTAKAEEVLSYYNNTYYVNTYSHNTWKSEYYVDITLYNY